MSSYTQPKRHTSRTVIVTTVNLTAPVPIHMANQIDYIAHKLGLRRAQLMRAFFEQGIARAAKTMPELNLMGEGDGQAD